MNRMNFEPTQEKMDLRVRVPKRNVYQPAYLCSLDRDPGVIPEESLSDLEKLTAPQ